MTYYEIGRETEVIVDESPSGLGAILAQKEKDAKCSKVVTGISRALTPVKSRYSKTERKAQAIRWACERLHSYLTGATFTVTTDHKPLLGIFNKKSSKSPITIERWVLFLQSYDFTVVYRPGETNPRDYAFAKRRDQRPTFG